VEDFSDLEITLDEFFMEGHPTAGKATA
jgi:hypothetical protein